MNNTKYLSKEGKLYKAIVKAAKVRAENDETIDIPKSVKPKRKGGCSCHG